MKKTFTLLTALAATVAMQAAETQDLTCWLSICDDDNNWTYASETITVKAQIDGNDVVFVDWLNSSQSTFPENNPQRDMHFHFSDDYVVTCDVKASGYSSGASGWKHNQWQLGEYGTFDVFYLATESNNQCRYLYDPATKFFRIQTYFENRIYYEDNSYETIDGSDGYYCLAIQMPNDFLSDVQYTLNATGQLKNDGATDYGTAFNYTQTATADRGVVTLLNYLGSSQNVEITVYNDGKARQTGGLDKFVEDTYTVDGAEYAKVYFTRNGQAFNASYDPDANKLTVNTYLYAADNSSKAFKSVYELPSSFSAPSSYPYFGSGNAHVDYLDDEGYVTATLADDGTLTFPSFLGSSIDYVVKIGTDDSGSKTAEVVTEAATNEISEITVNGTAYNKMTTATPGTAFSYYNVGENGASDTIGFYLYLWKSDGSGYDGDYFVVDLTSAAGVRNITVDGNSDAPIEYFNLNGVRLNGDNLTPGLYIRRQGTKATKVIVR